MRLQQARKAKAVDVKVFLLGFVFGLLIAYVVWMVWLAA